MITILPYSYLCKVELIDLNQMQGTIFSSKLTIASSNSCKPKTAITIFIFLYLKMHSLFKFTLLLISSNAEITFVKTVSAPFMYLLIPVWNKQ